MAKRKISAGRNKRPASSRRKPASVRLPGASERTKQATRPDPAHQSKTKIRLFRIIAISLVPLFILLLELGLRVAHFGYPPRPMIPGKLQGRKVFYNNPYFSWRFFPRQAARHPDPYVFEAKKSPDTYRIFILGASAAQGTPDSAFSFGRILQCMLARRFPETRFEVINTAMVATNSHVTRLIAKECARHAPDLFIVYLGNNEVVGPFGAGSVLTGFSQSYMMIRLQNTLSAMRIGQGFRYLREKSQTKPKVWGGMEMFLEQQVRRCDKRLEKTYSYFYRNLESIVKSGKRGGADVLISTVACNLRDCAPFASLHRQDLTADEKNRWKELVDKGIVLEDNGEFAAATEQYEQALEIDDTYGDLHFRLGCCYDALKNHDKAKIYYMNALKEDTLRFRADSRINQTIRSVTEKYKDGVRLVDAIETIEQNSPQGISGKEFFYEHVHLNFSGNYLLARTYLEKIEELPTFSSNRQKGEVLRESQCAEKLLYTDWSKVNILRTVLNDFLRKPPFTNQLYQDRKVGQMEKLIGQLDEGISPEYLNEVANEYRSALKESPNDWWLRCKYALLLENNPSGLALAAEQYRSILQRFEKDTYANAKLSMVAGRMGQIDQAIEYGKAAIRLSPGHVFAWYNLGLARYLNGEKKEARKCFEQVITLAPDHVDAYKNLTALFSERGDYKNAETICRRALKNIPGNIDLHINLAVVLKQRNRIDEARQVLNKALQLAPDSKRAKIELEHLNP